MRERERLVVENDQDEEVELPSKRVVCTRCEGRGKHVNPSIDGNGLTAADFAEDPDFKEAYCSGVYDVPCHECKGLRVVLVADEDRMTPEERQLWERHLQNQAEAAAERRYQERYQF